MMNRGRTILSLLTFFVFLFLDILDRLLCPVYKYLDEYLEGAPPSCYCDSDSFWKENEKSCIFGQLNSINGKEPCFNAMKRNRWSDCGCKECVAWMTNDFGSTLHVVVQEPPKGEIEKNVNETENVIFLHGFLCSSSFWTETVFPNFIGKKYTLFAVDLLGFGRSSKPNDCLYTIEDHVSAIQNSVIDTHKLTSFHLVAHSMGCIIALALAAKLSKKVKSITLVAPPFFPSSKNEASTVVLHKIAPKRLWPPFLFGIAFMSWYEHLGRCVCFFVCKFHRTWERIAHLITWKRDLHFMVTDFTKHTHHSAWHSMHNVICGGSKMLDDFLDTLVLHGVKISVVHGGRDILIPEESVEYIRRKAPNAHISIIANASHESVILTREKEFVAHLQAILEDLPPS